jgi:hypothetical protein
MRLAAGSNPAARTIHTKQQGNKMSYHGQPPPDYNSIGIAVVNPLHRIEMKLKKVQDVLDNISDQSVLTANDLKCKIEKVLKEG